MYYGMRAHAVQNSDQCSAQMVYKAVHAPTLKKCSAEIYERAVQEHNQCSTGMFTKQCTTLEKRLFKSKNMKTKNET